MSMVIKVNLSFGTFICTLQNILTQTLRHLLSGSMWAKDRDVTMGAARFEAGLGSTRLGVR